MIDPPYDTPPKRSFKGEQREQAEDGRDLHLSREGGGSKEGMEGGDVETSETEKAMENLKADLNIDRSLFLSYHIPVKLKLGLNNFHFALLYEMNFH